MRVGTRGVATMIWPGPASVGARMATRIATSQRESPGEYHPAGHRARDGRQRQADTKETSRPCTARPEQGEIGVAGIREEQQHEADFGKMKQALRIDCCGKIGRSCNCHPDARDRKRDGPVRTVPSSRRDAKL